MSEQILSVENLTIEYNVAGKAFHAVRGVSFCIGKGEVFGLVGESGSGKTTLGMAILGNLPRSSRVRGSIGLGNISLLDASQRDLDAVRWRKLSYVPQGAMSALNPVRRIFDQFLDLMRAHDPSMVQDARAQMGTLMAKMGLPPNVVDLYPHQLSGGMKQRIAIAMAIIFRPQLIIADEPTSALDVISQREVLQSLAGAQEQSRSAVILIGHDLALQAQVADRIGIMYRGRLLEVASTREIFRNPLHPYTRNLLASVPSVKVKQNLSDFLNSAEEPGGPREDVPDLPLIEHAPGHFAAI